MRRPVLVGTAPCSWGVWYADDPHQVPWPRFLDEVAQAGYRRIELGPYGYLPTDPAVLGRELAARGLTVTAGTAMEHLHRPGSWASTWAQVGPAAALAAAVGAEHLVLLPDFRRDPATGRVVEQHGLTDDAWARYGEALTRLGGALRAEHGLRLQLHPHADTQVETPHDVERLLAATDPDAVSLCLDTGHLAYGGGDALALIAAHPERVGYVHLKQVDPDVLTRVRAEGLGFGEAVRAGVMCEPPRGVPELGPVLDALAGLGREELLAVVEQDLYPCEPEVPLPVARRTRALLSGWATRPDDPAPTGGGDGPVHPATPQEQR